MERELDSRITAEGDRVALRWDPRSGRVAIVLEPADDSPARRAPVPPERAGDAFRHPYLYLPAEMPGLLAAA